MKRILYDKLKGMNISTLEVHRCLEVAGVEVSKRSVQLYIDSDLTACKDDRIRKVVDAILASKEALTKTLEAIK